MTLEPIERMETKAPRDRVALGLVSGKIDLRPLADLVETKTMGEIGTHCTSPRTNWSNPAAPRVVRTSASFAAR